MQLWAVIPYGVSVLHDVEPDENGKVDTTKVYVEATNPVIAMAEMWETHIQIAVSAGLSTIAELFRKAIEKDDLERTVNSFCEMIESDDDEFVKAFLQAIYRTQPDVISIGNPHILNNVIAGAIQPEKFSADVENFLKMVSLMSITKDERISNKGTMMKRLFSSYGSVLGEVITIVRHNFI